MLKCVLTCFISLVVVTGMLAQSTPSANKNLTLSIGLNQGYLKDLNFSPLNYTIGGSRYHLAYSSIKNDRLFLTSIDFNQNKLKTVLGTGLPKTIHLHGKAEISWLKKSFYGSGQMNLFLGGQFQTNLSYLDFEDESYSFLVAHSLGLTAFGRYRLNDKHVIQSHFSLPILTLIVRPPYAGFDEQLEENSDKIFKLLTNGYITSVNKYIAPTISIQYQYRINNRFSIGAAYQLDFQKLFQTDAYTAFHNRLAADISYRF